MGRTNTLDYDQSRQLGQRFDARGRLCWSNSFRCMMQANIVGAVYVEGWIVTPSGLLLEHGWLTCDGVVIDPTFALTYEKEVAVRIRYFAGVLYTKAEASALLRVSKELPLVWEYGLSGENCPDYMTAYFRALMVVMSGDPMRVAKQMAAWTQNPNLNTFAEVYRSPPRPNGNGS